MKMICYSRRSAQIKLLIPESFISFDRCHFEGSLKVNILYESLLRGFIFVSGTFRFSFGHSAKPDMYNVQNPGKDQCSDME